MPPINLYTSVVDFIYFRRPVEEALNTQLSAYGKSPLISNVNYYFPKKNQKNQKKQLLLSRCRALSTSPCLPPTSRGLTTTPTPLVPTLTVRWGTRRPRPLDIGRSTCSGMVSPSSMWCCLTPLSPHNNHPPGSRLWSNPYFRQGGPLMGRRSKCYIVSVR